MLFFFFHKDQTRQTKPPAPSPPPRLTTLTLKAMSASAKLIQQPSEMSGLGTVSSLNRYHVAVCPANLKDSGSGPPSPAEERTPTPRMDKSGVAAINTHHPASPVHGRL